MEQRKFSASLICLAEPVTRTCAREIVFSMTAAVKVVHFIEMNTGVVKPSVRKKRKKMKLMNLF